MSEVINLKDVKADIRKVLVIGAEGTGKTHFIGTFPKPILLISFDKGYLTLAGEEGIDVISFIDEDRKKPTAFAEFEKYLVKVSSEKKYATVALDNITRMSQWLFDYIAYANGMVDKKASYTEYQLIKSKTQDILNRCVAMSQIVVATALITTDKDESTGQVWFVPDLMGSIRDEIGSWFDMVGYMETVKSAVSGITAYNLLTVGSRQHRARLRIPSSIKIEPVEVPDFSKLMKKIRGE